MDTFHGGIVLAGTFFKFPDGVLDKVGSDGLLQLHPFFRSDHVGAQACYAANDFLTSFIVVSIGIFFQESFAMLSGEGVYIGTVFPFRFSVIHFVTDNFLDDGEQGLGIHQAENSLGVQVAHVILQESDPEFQHFQLCKGGGVAFDSLFGPVFDELLGDVLEISVDFHFFPLLLKGSTVWGRDEPPMPA